MITRVILALGVLGLGWIATLAGVMYVTDAAPSAVVFFPPDDLLYTTPSDTSVLSRGVASLTLKSEAPGFTASLYRSGAWLVLPGGLSGCSPK